MLRIRFTALDLGRVRLAAGPALMWETVLSLHWLQRGSAGPAGAAWRHAMARRLSPDLGLLRALVPPRGYIPDFLTPYGCSADPVEAVAPLLDTSVSRLRREVGLLAVSPGVKDALRPLAEGRSSAVRRLGEALVRYHRVAVGPFWPTVRDEVAAERARAAALLADGGAEGLLGRLSPRMRWSGSTSTLAVDYPVERELSLEGRGLLLVPSYFCEGTPITLVRQEDTPVLVLPIARTPGFARDAALPGLLGCSRAAVLEAAADGGSTSELACRAGVLVSSASQHLTVLRRAGLVVSRREANVVFHAVTSLGTDLLRGRQSAPQQV
ncbi:ArsR/SmtB family transcription factor [Streptomyces sp. 351MFTsu5.1]|uniref:ArsR/SmtB family transcription factor n=1 Tax=Streptomyces sp. 351MFTsu5.1 TaxID=1172180 RepID=UPI00037206B5|nr:helix-turn-helix transcriptional regulator [Streptomyces sp. 351MFTsu5.1]